MFARITSSWPFGMFVLLGVILSSCRSKEAPTRDNAAPSGAVEVAQATPEVLRVGVLAPFSGPFASLGAQIEGGIKAYLAQHGDTVAGRKVELLVRDTTGVAPDVAKRL